MADLGRQTKPVPYPDEVVRFGDALESIMEDGTHDLDAIVAQLNARGVRVGDRTTWTPESFRTLVAELAAAED